MSAKRCVSLVMALIMLLILAVPVFSLAEKEPVPEEQDAIEGGEQREEASEQSVQGQSEASGEENEASSQETPESAATPEPSETAEAPETQEESSDPIAHETAAPSETPEAPKHSDDAETPESPEDTKEPEASDASEDTEEPEASDAPESSEESEAEDSLYALVFHVTPAEADVSVYAWIEPTVQNLAPDYDSAEPISYREGLAPGTYHYIITAEGYAPAEADFTLKDEDKTFYIELMPLMEPALEQEPISEEAPLAAQKGFPEDMLETNDAPVARIGDTEYASLDDALAYAATDGSVTQITMMADEQLGYFWISDGKRIDLRLNSYTVTTAVVVESNCSLTVTGPGTIQLLAGENVIANSGTLTVAGGARIINQDRSGNCAVFNNGGSVTIDGGQTLIQGYTAIRTEGGSLTVRGGTIEGTSTLKQAIETTGNSTISLSGGAFSLYPDESWIAPGCEISVDGNGFWTVIPLPVSTYTVAVEVFPEGAGEVACAGAYAEGETVTLAVTPAAGFALETLTCATEGGETVDVLADQDGAYSFSMPASNVTVTAVFRPQATYSASLTLNENINVNFYVENVSSEEIKKYTVQTSVNGGAWKRVTEYTDKGSAGYRFVLARIHAYQMTYPVEIKVFYDNGTEPVFSMTGDNAYSAKRHLMYLYDHVNDYKALAIATMNYGAAAQEFFKGKIYGDSGQEQTYDCTDTLANSELANGEKTLPTEGPDNRSSVSGSIADLKVKSASLLLGTETSIKIYFTYSGDVNDLTFSSDKTNGDSLKSSLRSESGESLYSVKITGIHAPELKNDYTLTITKGSESVSVTYSAFAYARNQWNASDTLLRNLARALYAYGKAAGEKWSN